MQNRRPRMYFCLQLNDLTLHGFSGSNLRASSFELQIPSRKLRGLHFQRGTAVGPPTGKSRTKRCTSPHFKRLTSNKVPTIMSLFTRSPPVRGFIYLSRASNFRFARRCIPKSSRREPGANRNRPDANPKRTETEPMRPEAGARIDSSPKQTKINPARTRSDPKLNRCNRKPNRFES